MEAFYWYFPEVPVHGSLENKLSRQMTTSSCLFIVLRLLGFLSWRPLKEEPEQKKIELFRNCRRKLPGGILKGPFPSTTPSS